MLNITKQRITASCLLSLTLTLGTISMPVVYAQGTKAQTPDNNSTDLDTSELRTLNPANSLLSLEGGKKLMEEASEAIDGQRYQLAAVKLKEARQVFNQLSNFYLQLANSFSGIDIKIYEEQRSNALKTGQMRDEATYQLALVHRAQDKPELSVPLLIQVIRSQNPTSQLGQKSYQQLYELGFVSAPYERSSK